jgi:hypothetical protein
MTIESQPIYAGISLVSLDAESFDLGHGVSLTTTYAHLMAPFVMAFAPAPPGKHHPAPWSAAKGGLALDIQVQLFVPTELQPPGSFDRLNTVWLIAALMRLTASPLVQVSVISDQAFAAVAGSKAEPELLPIEVSTRRLLPVENPGMVLDATGLAWIRDHWFDAGKLLSQSEDLSTAFQAFDATTMAASISVAMMTLWGAIEQIFSPAKQELRFRVSALLASYLEPPGPDRLSLHKRILKLYDKRSEVAHGAASGNAQAFRGTYDLMARALLKIIEQRHVPTRDELEQRLFGSGLSS